MDNLEGKVIDILEENGLIGSSWNAYENIISSKADGNTLIVNGYGGLSTLPGVEFPRFQIMARASIPLDARDKMQQLFNFFSLMRRGSLPFTKSYGYYSIQILPLQSSPINMGVNDSRKEYLFSLNFEVLVTETDIDLLVSPSGRFLVNPYDGALLIQPT